MKSLLESIVRSLVDLPDKVVISETCGLSSTILEISVDKSDVGKVIGRSGRNAEAIRTLIASAAFKSTKKYIVQIIDSKNEVVASGT